MSFLSLERDRSSSSVSFLRSLTRRSHCRCHPFSIDVHCQFVSFLLLLFAVMCRFINDDDVNLFVQTKSESEKLILMNALFGLGAKKATNEQFKCTVILELKADIECLNIATMLYMRRDAITSMCFA